MSTTDPRVRSFGDSLFLVTWKRANMVMASYMTCCSAITPPETLAVSSSDSLQYDVSIEQITRAHLVWTTGTLPEIMVLSRWKYRYDTGGWTTTDTTLTQLASLPSPHLFVGFADMGFLYEQGFPVKQDVMICRGRFPGVTSQNISQDSSSVDLNAQAFQLPIITKVSYYSAATYYNLDLCVYEKYRGTDSMLVFLGYNQSDTVRSQGYNRNACVGSQLWSGRGGLHVLVVWESNRSGKLHIYSREATLLILDVSDPTTSPTEFKLYQNYPNPFNPSTTIRYIVSKGGTGEAGLGTEKRGTGSAGSGGWGLRASWVKLSVYDILGREVAVLLNGLVEAGEHEVTFDGRNLSSGVYFYRMQAGEFVQSRKLVLVK
jgi:hypothetical protein